MTKSKKKDRHTVRAVLYGRLTVMGESLRNNTLVTEITINGRCIPTTLTLYNARSTGRPTTEIKAIPVTLTLDK